MSSDTVIGINFLPL